MTLLLEGPFSFSLFRCVSTPVRVLEFVYETQKTQLLVVLSLTIHGTEFRGVKTATDMPFKPNLLIQRFTINGETCLRVRCK